MSQLSRPYQIALGAIALLAAVWFFALRGHSQSSSEPSASTPAPAPASRAQGPGATTPVVHGTAPGVEGLTRAINKAHEAVAQSERSARQLGEKSEQASSSSASPSSSSSTAAGGVAKAGSGGTAAPAARATTSTPRSASPAHGKGSSSAATRSGSSRTPSRPSSSQSNTLRTPERQVLVERALKEGKIAVLLFWNPKGIDDRAVRTEVLVLEQLHHLIAPKAGQPAVRRLLSASKVELQKKIAVFEARASEVTSFGSITRAVQIYQTPTILVVNARGLVTTITGLTDYYALEQAIDEARNS